MTMVPMVGDANVDPVWGCQADAGGALAMLPTAERCDEYSDLILTRGEAWLCRQDDKVRRPSS